MHLSSFLTEFRCLGAECPDTCCKGWGMQVDGPTQEKYAREAPELLPALDSGEADIIMRRDPATDHCVKLESGLCRIHTQYGDGFLGDACHFYPRSVRALGEETIMTASLSCPEVVRLALTVDAPFAHTHTDITRLPVSLHDYLPGGMAATDALAIHRAFLEAGNDIAAPPAHAMLRIVSVAGSLQHLPTASWAAAVPFYFKQVEGRIPPPTADARDPLHLVQALLGLVMAAKPSPRPRLAETIQDMENFLGIRIDRDNLHIAMTDATPAQLQQAVHAVQDARLYPLLRRYLQAELALALFPFAGFGGGLHERAFILGVRMGTVRLALAALHARNPAPPETEIVRVIQSISRFMDHLADPEYSVQIYRDAGWMDESRLRGMLEG